MPTDEAWLKADSVIDLLFRAALKREPMDSFLAMYFHKVKPLEPSVNHY